MVLFLYCFPSAHAAAAGHAQDCLQPFVEGDFLLVNAAGFRVIFPGHGCRSHLLWDCAAAIISFQPAESEGSQRCTALSKGTYIHQWLYSLLRHAQTGQGFLFSALASYATVRFKHKLGVMLSKLYCPIPVWTQHGAGHLRQTRSYGLRNQRP